MTGELRQILLSHSRPAAPELVRREDDGALRCLACGNRCRVPDGGSGICRVRMNGGGMLRVPGGYVAGLNVDPIEKKPFYHVFPGQTALSFGMLGCNLHCSFCQNWISSQVLKDTESGGSIRPVTAQRLADMAVESGAPVLVSTYNEPLITADWAREVFEKACERGIVCGFVSNGYATPEVVAFLRPVMKLYKVDLKCFSESGYRELGGRLKTVLETIALLRELDYWVEVVTLVVPGFNDDPEQLAGMAKMLAALDPCIPWHVTAFHRDYRRTQGRDTNAGDLRRAYDAGKEAGLRYVYAGNLPGRMAGAENTYCPQCGALLIERCGFHVHANRLANGACPLCRHTIPGVWESAGTASGQNAEVNRSDGRGT